MKLSQQLERVIFELKRGQQVILSDENNISHILLSSTETIDKKTLSFHRNLSNSYPNIILSPERCKKLNIKSNDFRFCVELPLKMELAKMSYKTIPSYEKKRIGGKKKVNAFKDGFLILSQMIKLFFEKR